MSYYTYIDILKQEILTFCMAGREPILGAMWFVYALLISLCGYSIVSWIISKFIKNGSTYDWIRLIVFTVLCGISCTLTNYYSLTIPRLSNAVSCMPLIFIGNQIWQRFHVKFSNVYVAMLSLLIMYLIFIFEGRMSLNGNKFNSPMHLVGTTFSTIYVLSYFSIKIQKTRIASVIAYCGKDSFYIMALHFISFKICTLFLNALGYDLPLYELEAPTENNLFYLIMYVFIGVSFPLLFMWGFRYTKSHISRFLIRK